MEILIFDGKGDRQEADVPSTQLTVGEAIVEFIGLYTPPIEEQEQDTGESEENLKLN